MNAMKAAALMLLLAAPVYSQARTCDDFGHEFGCKADPPVDGTYACAGVTVELDFYELGQVVDWQGGPLSGVYVKGGPGYRSYVYDPPATSGTGLLAPEGRQISHVLMCHDGAEPPPPSGACCLPEGACYQASETECENNGGSWTEGANCDEVQCHDPPPPPVPTLPAAGLVTLAALLALIAYRRL